MARKRQNTAAQPGPDYDVGYAKPPKHSQFKPGNSANPRGRPKGSKNKAPKWSHGGFDALIREEAHRSMTITDNGRPVTMPVMQAVIRRVSIDALQGRSRAQKLFLNELLGGAERRNNALFATYQEEMIRYKMEQRQLLDDAIAFRRPIPELIPHPDDIVIDVSTGEPSLIGPRTHEEKAAWEFLARGREKARHKLAEWETELDTTQNEDHRNVLQDSISEISEQLAGVVAQIGEWPKHHTEFKSKRKGQPWNWSKTAVPDAPKQKPEPKPAPTI